MINKGGSKCLIFDGIALAVLRLSRGGIHFQCAVKFVSSALVPYLYLQSDERAKMKQNIDFKASNKRPSCFMTYILDCTEVVEPLDSHGCRLTRMFKFKLSSKC